MTLDDRNTPLHELISDANAAEMLQQALPRPLADSGHFQELGGPDGVLAAKQKPSTCLKKCHWRMPGSIRNPNSAIVISRAAVKVFSFDESQAGGNGGTTLLKTHSKVISNSG